MAHNLYSFNNLKYSVSDKIILNNINGAIPKNKLTAILGKSGAGKTSLMSILSGRLLDGQVEGDIYINNTIFDNRYANYSTAYVQQEDILSDNLTVYELFNLCAILKLKDKQNHIIKQKINEILNVLELEDCKDTIIGNNMHKGISGGEKKRVSIGLELINDPDIIFLDEPTSGLDSYNAFNVMNLLKKLTNLNKTVITILHQPTSEVFESIDHLIILNDGDICYCNKRNLVIPRLQKINLECPIYTNPADFLFRKILSNERNFQLFKQNKIHYLLPPEVNNHRKKMNNTGNSFIYETKILLERNIRELFRDRISFKFKIIQAIFLSMFLSLIFFKLDYSQTSIQNRIGITFYLSINTFMSSVYGTLHTFFHKKTIFFREYQSRWYNFNSYFISKIIADMPLNLIISILMTSIIYFWVGLQNNADKYFTFLGIIIMSTSCGNILGTFISSLFDYFYIAMIFVPTIMMPMLLFSGFFVNNETIPVYFDWIKYLSPIKYNFNALALNEFDGLKFECTNEEINNDQCLYKTGEDVIDYLNFDSFFTINMNVLFLGIYYCLFIYFTYIILKKKIDKKIDIPYAKLNKESPNNNINIRQTLV